MVCVYKKNIALALFSLMMAWPFSLQGATAAFAGGSFWVMEALFAERVGISQVTVGWMQTSSRHPRRQAVWLEYDPQHISYGELLTLYWAAIDPFDNGGQFCDRGQEYRPALYVQSALQQRFAQQSRAKIALDKNQRVQARIFPASTFTPALARHQQYYRKQPLLYAGYRRVCGYPAGERFKLSALAGGQLATSAQ